jgi:molybdopterin-containing oxidoreductase family iron-sulfur binding subunit
MVTGKSYFKEISRRDFLKVGGLGLAVAVVATTASQVVSAQSTIAGKKLAMVIDLHRCTGCGACMITCKNENNVQGDVFWCSRISQTVGKFPDVRYEYITTLCNHCENAPCVKGCPTGAMHKGDGDITMHEPEKCIGCRYCIINCPYGVIHFNEGKTHEFWREDKPLIAGATTSAVEVTQRVGGTVIPYYNPDKERSLPGMGLRRKGIVEKCTLCDHRVSKGELPYCVEGCPANARIFGDLNDPNSEVSQLLGKFSFWRLKENLGTEPKVFYIRSFNKGNNRLGKGSV